MTGQVVIIHNIDHARAAAAAAAELSVPVTLRSAPGAAGYLGPQVFRSMIEQAVAEYPDAKVQSILDCGNDPGLALAALRHGVTCVAIAADRDVLDRIADIAGQSDATLDNSNGPALDLAEANDAAGAVHRWLTANG
jgi:hypothetical protein